MSRSGGALPAALLLIVLLGGLGGLALATARLRAVTAGRTMSQAKVVTIAESALERAEAAWDPIRAGGLGVGVAQGLSLTTPARGLVSYDSLLRLGNGLFLVRSTSQQLTSDGYLLARTALARLIRLEGPTAPDSVAALVAGGVSVASDSGIQGEDAVPAGWDSLCPPSAPPSLGLGQAPGVVASLTCPGGTCLSGVPPVAVDSGLPAALFAGLGASPMAALLAHRDVAVSGTVLLNPSQTGGLCDRTRGDNWGDPGNPGGACGRYFPIVAAGTGTEVGGGAGQGLLLAVGDLVLSGSAHFDGVVLALGDVTLEDRAEVLGVLLVQGSLRVADSARVRRSACAVQRALAGSARPLRIVPRGTWRWP